jgi:hypothetical protein
VRLDLLGALLIAAYSLTPVLRLEVVGGNSCRETFSNGSFRPSIARTRGRKRVGRTSCLERDFEAGASKSARKPSWVAKEPPDLCDLEDGGIRQCRASF